jgi:hypothetical protein
LAKNLLNVTEDQQKSADDLYAEDLFIKLLLASGYLCRNGNSLSIPNQELREKLKENISQHYIRPKYSINIEYYNKVTSILTTILDNPQIAGTFTGNFHDQFEMLLNEAEANKGDRVFLVILGPNMLPITNL